MVPFFRGSFGFQNIYMGYGQYFVQSMNPLKQEYQTLEHNRSLHTQVELGYFHFGLEFSKECLQVEFQDYMEGQQYKKIYTNESIIEINPKLDLEDVYYSFNSFNSLPPHSLVEHSAHKMENAENEETAELEHEHGDAPMLVSDGPDGIANMIQKYGHGKTIWNGVCSLIINQGGIIHIDTKIITIRGGIESKKNHQCVLRLDLIQRIPSLKLLFILNKKINKSYEKLYEQRLAQMQSKIESQQKQLKEVVTLSKRRFFPIKVILPNKTKVCLKIQLSTEIRSFKDRLNRKYGINWSYYCMHFEGKPVTNTTLLEQGIGIVDHEVFVVEKTRQMPRRSTPRLLRRTTGLKKESA